MCVFSIVSTRRWIVDAKLQRERELRRELDTLSVQNERKLLSLQRDRHQFIGRYYYLCRKARMISKRCADLRTHEMHKTNDGVSLMEERGLAEEEQERPQHGGCYGSANLPPLWLSGVNDITANCSVRNIVNPAKRKLMPSYMDPDPKLSTNKRTHDKTVTFPATRVEDKREKEYQLTLPNCNVNNRNNHFPSVGESTNDTRTTRGRFRSLAKVLTGWFNKSLTGGALQTERQYRRQSHEKVLLTIDELSSCRYLRIPKDRAVSRRSADY